METRLINYILTINRCKSVSRAAEELFLTQSALNQQLLKLEEELGAPLFIRTRNNWQPTQIGTIYIQNAEKMLSIKEETYSQIQDIAQRWRGTVTVGLVPERGALMFSAIYPEIHSKYPDTIFQPVEATVAQQIQMLKNGRLDISFQTIYERTHKNLICNKILYEPFYLCIPATHPLAYLGAPFGREPYPEIDLRSFRNDLFTLVRRSSTMRTVIDQLFKDAEYVPHLLFESTSMHTMQQLASIGQCCTIIPKYYAMDNKNVVYFALGPKAGWDVVAVYKKNHYLTKAARDFINLASEHWVENQYMTIQ
ncbi:MAG: LysR family transcriptional regulator [Lachnospiraceae bacterium]